MAARPSPQTERLVAVVDAIAERPEQGLTLAEIARHLGVSPATCHPMLASLTALGWLIRHPVRRTYRLGPALVTAGRAAARGLGVVDLVRPVMHELAGAFGLSCVALTPGEQHVTVAEIVRAPGAHEPHMRVGDQVPIAAPLGIGYICWADEATVRRWIARTAGDAVGRRHLEAVVDAARRRGFTVELVTDLETDLRTALAELDDLAPAGAARLRTLLESLTAGRVAPDAAQLVDIDPHATYRVGRLGAPVFGPDGDLALILALYGFGPHTGGAELEETGRRLAKAAAGA